MRSKEARKVVNGNVAKHMHRAVMDVDANLRFYARFYADEHERGKKHLAELFEELQACIEKRDEHMKVALDNGADTDEFPWLEEPK